MEFDPSYAYLQYDLLDNVVFITIILSAKSPHIELCEQHLRKGMLVKVNNVGIESKFKKVFEKGDIHVVIIIQLTTIVLSIIRFHLSWLNYVFSHGFHEGI
jgi:hypothetical protein